MTTAKRFTVEDGLEDVLFWEIHDKENEDMTCGEFAKLLNELHEENQQCKKYNAKLYSSIMNNERYWLKQLKQLHQTLDDMIETERTELGRSVLKQLKEAIK